MSEILPIHIKVVSNVTNKMADISTPLRMAKHGTHWDKKLQ